MDGWMEGRRERNVMKRKGDGTRGFLNMSLEDRAACAQCAAPRRSKFTLFVFWCFFFFFVVVVVFFLPTLYFHA